MKRIIITSPSFTGEVRLLYAEDGRLIQFDCTGSDGLSVKQIAWLKAQAPAEFTPDLPAAFAGAKAAFHFAEEGATPTFEEFYEAYGVKLDKKRAETGWNRLSKADRTAAYLGIARYNRHLAAHPWKNKKEPKTYISHRSWENDFK
jgi:hypothetical protein